LVFNLLLGIMKRSIYLIIIVAIFFIMIITSCKKMAIPHTTPPSAGGLVTTLAGPGFIDASLAGVSASFNNPLGVAADSLGNVYVADSANNMIRKITPSGLVSTFAGSLNPGSANGMDSAASFNHPTGVALDGSGNLYVADYGNSLIRKISPTGMVSTLAGVNGNAGSTNGPAASATFNHPMGVAVDGAGNVYVADYLNNMIREISSSGVVSTLAGTGMAGSANGAGAVATFNNPTGVAVDLAGNVYVADLLNNLIREISPSGIVSTLAGNNSLGFHGGVGTAATFSAPFGIAVDTAGNLYVGEEGNQIIRMITPGAQVTILAGTGAVGSLNGAAATATFYWPSGVAVNKQGNVYVADHSNNLIRQINIPTQTVTTLAGNRHTKGVVNTSTFINNPTGVAVDGQYNIYVADYNSNLILEISSSGEEYTLAGTGLKGSASGLNALASFWMPFGIAADQTGNVYVADLSNNLVREVSVSGLVSTVAGTGSAGSANGPFTGASFNSPSGVVLAPSGTLYVADSKNNLIRAINAAGIVSTFAGSGTAGSTDGMGTAASFNGPTGIAVDMTGNLYVADQGNNLIRKISAAGMVSTLAGDGSQGSTNGTGVAASFNHPTGVAVDAGTNVYVADYGNNMIRYISSAGAVTTWAGSGGTGSANGRGTAASFNGPFGVAVDANENVYVADYYNNLIRKITP
jgi:sugar lactone lactonase YvrE